ncbi:hypothetical protein Q2941_30645 [Bradyrhizobium sp. UFLA05-153]
MNDTSFYPRTGDRPHYEPWSFDRGACRRFFAVVGTIALRNA